MRQPMYHGNIHHALYVLHGGQTERLVFEADRARSHPAVMQQPVLVQDRNPRVPVAANKAERQIDSNSHVRVRLRSRHPHIPLSQSDKS